MRQRRNMRNIGVGLVAALLTWVLLGFVTERVAFAQDDLPTPTPAVEETTEEGEEGEPTATPAPSPTPLPTPRPSIRLQGLSSIAPDGDLDENNRLSPGDRVEYTVRLSNGGPSNTGLVDVVVTLDESLIGNIEQVSNGGLVDGGQVVWTFENIANGEQLELTFTAALRRTFPPGITRVTGSVVVRAQNVQLAQANVASIEVVGPSLRFGEEAVELINDLNENSAIDPGDTIRFTLNYQNTGGGPSQEASVVANIPEDTTANIINNPDAAQVTDQGLTWLIGSVPANEAEVRSVRFSVELTEPFPAGATSYDVPIEIRGANNVLDSRVIAVPISGPVLAVAPRFELITDGNNDGLIDPGDTIQVAISYENVGTEPATQVSIVSTFPQNRLDTLLVENNGVTTQGASQVEIAWPSIDVPQGTADELVFQARVASLEPGTETLNIGIQVNSPQVATTTRQLAIPVVAPAAEGEVNTITESRPPQGTGILSGTSVAVLIGGFLTFSMLSIAYVASRVLPSTTEERDTENEEIRASHRRMVRELIEGVILTAILFSVMILGLQNALDQDSVNSIIAGIVGYVAGRVAGQN